MAGVQVTESVCLMHGGHCWEMVEDDSNGLDFDVVKEKCKHCPAARSGRRCTQSIHYDPPGGFSG